MENWYSDIPMMSLELQLKSTELDMKRGFISRDELAAYEYLSRKIYWKYIMGDNSEKSKELRIKRDNAKTKTQLKELFEEMNLLEELEELLKLNWLEISKLEYAYFGKHMSEFQAKGDQEEQMHYDELDKLREKKK